MPFEYAVRPFQSRDSFGRIILPSTPSGAAERATLTWGSSASLPPGTLPTPTTMGVNMKCCQEIRTQDGAEMEPVNVQVQGPGAIEIPVKRSNVVLAKKQDENHCDDWLAHNSYVAASVKESFVGIADAIHASDREFLPAGAAAACREKTTFKYDGASDAV